MKPNPSRTNLPRMLRVAGTMLFCAALLIGCGKPKPAASKSPYAVIGNVTLQGVPPPEIVIQMDSACAKLQTNTPTTHHYVVAANGGLADVFITIRAEFDAKQFPVPTNAGRMGVVACQYEPHVIGVRVGQPIHFENNTGIMDNWHCTPKLNPEFNFAGMPGTTQIKSFRFAEDFVRVKCDIHPWMFGYICVVDHPFFAITDTNGSFTLPNGLPDGTYTLEALHLKAGSLKKQITVHQGHSEPVDFVFATKK